MNICLFDIDGTLLASGGAGKTAMEQALAEEFGVAVDDHKVPFSGRTDRAITRDLFRVYGIADTPENLRRYLDCYLGMLPGCLHSHQGRILPGIAELLELLAQRGHVHLGLLTGNVREGARLKLNHYGLYEFFSFGGFGDEHFDRDDVAREALAVARTHAGPDVNLERFWVIGDTPLDIQCARAIGARVAAVATGWHSLQELAAAQPDVVLTDLSDPAPLLAYWD
jgi:phosphoglycolate phosphatase-like HAD superfamily hydrolase